MARRRKSEIIVVYVVELPSVVVHPGKVILHIAYTRQAAKEFINSYPLKYLIPWMSVRTHEIIARETD